MKEGGKDVHKIAIVRKKRRDLTQVKWIKGEDSIVFCGGKDNKK